MDIFLVNIERNHAKSLCEKLSAGKDGGIIPLNKGEMWLYLSEAFQHVRFGADQNQMFTKMEPGAHYVAVIDPAKVEIEDVVNMSKRLHIELAVVRVRT